MPVTVRVPAELKDRVDTIASEIGISSSAVWKILLHRSVKPLLEGGDAGALDVLGAAVQSRKVEVRDARPGGPKRESVNR